MPVVSLQNTPCYEPSVLDRAVAAHFEALEAERTLLSGMHVLLKPNLLAARSPADAVTTHPEVLAAVARWLHARGIDRITLADSPGGPYTPASQRRLYAACGLDALRPLAVLSEDVSHGRRGGFSLITPVLEADCIINCAKLKTHGLTVMTGGVKNLFGCIPGLQKPEWHARRPSLNGFCDMLIDLCDAVRPAFTLIDAVDCMEGNGPGGGEIRHMGMTLASRDPYALDEQAALLMGMTSRMPPIVRASRQRGKLDEPVTLTGDPLIPAQPPFRLPDAVTGQERLFTFNGLFHRICGRGRVYPRVIADKCIGCGKCAESCPQHIIAIEERKARIRRKGCISCFCCQEMCPAHAIEAR